MDGVWMLRWGDNTDSIMLMHVERTDTDGSSGTGLMGGVFWTRLKIETVQEKQNSLLHFLHMR